MDFYKFYEMYKSVRKCKKYPKYRVKLHFYYTFLHFFTLFYIFFTLSIFAMASKDFEPQLSGIPKFLIENY